MAKTVVVVDGMGGGIGSLLIARLARSAIPDITVIALATNAVAAQRMAEAGAQRAASGENAFRVCLPDADYIIGPLGVALPNSMMGEVTPLIAEYVLAAKAKRVLLPLVKNHMEVVGLAPQSVGELIDEAIQFVETDVAKTGSC